MNSNKISIVIPVYNEGKNIEILYKSLITILYKEKQNNYEIIFVNDGSKDNSWEIIKNLAQINNHIKAINFNRNFGHQIALTAGYHKARGDAIISMDADMQHPPEVIPAMIKAWLQGFDIVYVKNIQRKDSFLKKITAIGYYKLMEIISNIKTPRNVADFRLIDKKVLSYINQSQEKARYLRGMVAWTGFNHTFIHVKFAKRFSGTTGYTWSKMFKLALDGMTGFSTSPFRLAAYFGCFITTSGLIMLNYLFYNMLFHSVHYQLFTWLVVIIYIFIGI